MDNHRGWWRIVDANFNRCSEGMRVLEDWSRFVADDPELSKTCKEMRHRLHELSNAWPLEQRLATRDVAADVGRTIKTESERHRSNELSFLQANCYRVQQSLRVLEEAAKLLELIAAPELEKLRYRSYELQQRLILGLVGPAQQVAADNKGRHPGGSAAWRSNILGIEEKTLEDRLKLLQAATLYVLTDACGGFAAFQQHVEQLVVLGVDVIQLREKSLTDLQLWEFSSWTAQFLAPTRVLLIINDRADIAAGVGADGVHVGQDELPVEAVRQVVGPERLIGVSTHEVKQVQTAQQTSANYLGLGPVFPSRTKSFPGFAGLETLRNCAPYLELPTFAIGGIDASNVSQVYATGLSRIAVQGALGPGKLSRAMVQTLRPTSVS
ncbi:MAG: thiamine phosphate synthase [Planctomycetaceae bacterium]|nr:thiamine phosphate synthase [Planctomycetaceae bacterium]